MTEPAFLADAYAREATATVRALTPDGGIVLGSTIFYARSGGQPGDAGWLSWDGGDAVIADTVKGEADAIVLVPDAGAALPAVGQAVGQRLDWDRRHGHMRVHTALHLLSVVIPLPVTGGAIGPDKGLSLIHI